MTAKGNRSRVVVIDALKLRQAGLVRLLEGWAESKNLEIVAIATSEDPSSVWAGCGMVVLNIGGTSVTDTAPQNWIRTARTFMSDVPIVVLSDREDCTEIRSAFRSGVSGFIPATLEPTLAMEALTFLSRGGSFFPCSVLLEESQTVRETTSRVLRGEPERQTIYRRPDADTPRAQVRIATRQTTWEPPAPRVINGEAEEEDDQDIDTSVPALTPRQQEVLERLSEGKSNKLIARDLEMTEATVKVHVRQIMRKFGATNRTQAALCAMRFATVSMAKRAR